MGLSVTVTVDTRDQSGPPRRARAAPAGSRSQPSPTRTRGPQVEALIARIIAENRGRGRPLMNGRRRQARSAARRSAITAFALALGTFMQVLDTTIANVSLPTIAGNLGVSTDQGTWVITAFAVANGMACR